MATLTKATRLLARPPQQLTASHHHSSEVVSTYLPFSLLLLMSLNTPHHAQATAIWNVHHEHASRKSIRPSLPKQGAEKEPCQAWGFPVGLFLMQAAEGVYSSGSSVSSSPLVVLLGKKRNLGFYPTWNVPVFLLEKLVTSPHFPSEPEIGLISFTSGVSNLHDCHLWVSLRTGWPHYHSPGPKLTSLHVFFTSKQ